MTAREDVTALDDRLVECERQCRVLLDENELLRGLLREGARLILQALSATDGRAFLDKLERFL